MKNFSGVCQAAGADKPLRAFFIWITNIVTLLVWDVFPEHEQLIIPAPVALLFFRNSRTVMILVPELHDMEAATVYIEMDIAFLKVGVIVSQVRISGCRASTAFHAAWPIPLLWHSGRTNRSSRSPFLASLSMESTTPPTFCPSRTIQ